MKHFLFIRGLPASGKITIARELEKKFGWRVLWIHGIKNAIWDVVKKHDLRELMRQVLDPIVKFMLDEQLDIIFVRTAMDQETIERVREAVAKYPDYRFDLVTLLADKSTLLDRVKSRPFDEHRPSDEKSLDEYLARIPAHEQHDERELVLDTTAMNVDDVVVRICEHFNYASSV